MDERTENSRYIELIPVGYPVENFSEKKRIFSVNYPMKFLFSTLYRRTAGENDEAGDY